MNDIVEIAPVTESDVPAVVELVKNTLFEFGITFLVGAPTDAQLLALPESYTAVGGAFFIARKNNIFCGTAGIFPLSKTNFELRKMYLTQHARGLGVGQRLLDKCLQHAREKKAERVVLDTIEQMTSAISFYEKNGFVRDDAFISASRCTRGYRLEL